MSNLQDFSRGSEWRKWDLHFHTPSSFDYEDNSVTNEEIVFTLLSNNIEAVVITDHHKIDLTRITELKKLCKGKIIFLPGIEFRSELGGSELMHFIGIWSEKSDIEYIWKQIQVHCRIDDTDIRHRGGYERIFCDFKDTSKIIHDLGGLISVHAGKKSNSLERLKNDIKDDLEVNKCIDILEIGDVLEVSDYYKIVFPNIKRIIPLVLCSDNHNIKNYSVNESLWIKADLTFDGLTQICYEPFERVKLQTNNPALDFHKSIFTEIEIHKSIPVFAGEHLLFDKLSLPLNQNLITIIGGRGTGKSVLINTLANGFKLFTPYEKESQFVRSSDMKIRWRKSLKGNDETFSFEKQHDLQFLFISQSEVKDKVKDPKELGKEIKKILELEDLSFSLQTDEIIQYYKNQCNSIQAWFEKLDENGNPINSRSYVQTEIERNRNLLQRITTEENQEKLTRYSSNIEKLETNESLKKKLLQLKSDLTDFQISTNEKIEILGGKIPIIDFSLQFLSIDKAIEEVDLAIKVAIDENSSIKNEFEDFKGDLTTLLTSVEKFSTSIITFERRLKEIEEKEKELSFAISNKKTIGQLILKELEDQKNTINQNWMNLLAGKEGWSKEQKDLMQNIINNRGIKTEGEIVLDKIKLYELFSVELDGRIFKGKNDFKELENFFGISSFENYIDFISNKFENIISENQKLFPKSVIDRYEDILFDLRTRSTYLYVQPKITIEGKSIEKISVGQRGTFYLCLKLATNIFSQTIIFDQPEDDLDNSFIFSDLIEIFKEIKRYRQVIIVTHNANLVVNADAEQVIIASNKDEKLSYTSGSLENPSINKAVCDILEGGKIAFQQRNKRYYKI